MDLLNADTYRYYSSVCDKPSDEGGNCGYDSDPKIVKPYHKGYNMSLLDSANGWTPEQEENQAMVIDLKREELVVGIVSQGRKYFKTTDEQDKRWVTRFKLQ